MIILGLGSNLGDRLAYLGAAIDALSGIISHITISRIYQSDALLPDNAPISWQLPFLNMAIAGETSRSPEELLIEIKQIEHTIGRADTYERWAPREIDIDILAYDKQVLEHPDLTIPHKDLLTRSFFLLPLAEVVPNWRYPVDGPYRNIRAEELVEQLVKDNLHTCVVDLQVKYG